MQYSTYTNVTQGRIQDFWKGGGSILGLQAKKKGGGSKRGSNFGPNVKKPTSWPKRGGGVRTPWTPHGSATVTPVIVGSNTCPFHKKETNLFRVSFVWRPFWSNCRRLVLSPMHTHLSADCYISVPDHHISANSSSERFCVSHVAVSIGRPSDTQVLRSSNQLELIHAYHKSSHNQYMYVILI